MFDVHTHIFPTEFIEQRERLLALCPWFAVLYANPKRRLVTAGQLIESMDAGGIDKAVVFGFPWTDPGRLSAANDYVFDAAAKSEGRLIPFAVVNPNDPALTEREVVRFHGRGIRGIGELMPDGQGFTLRDHALLEGVMRLAKFHGLTVMVHTSEPVGHDYPGKGEVKPEQVVRLAEEFPDVRMICAHWGGGLIFYELMPEVARLLSNVYYDSAASSLLYDDAIYELAARIAPTKILFGTDYPLIGQKRMLARVLERLNGSEHLEAFLHGNAERLLGV